MRKRFASAAEAAVLEVKYPPRMVASTRDMALHMYLALVERDARAGCPAPRGEWLQQLEIWAELVMCQIRYLSEHAGGTAMYLAKNAAFELDPRDRAIYDEFNGANYKELARKYDMTEVWVREIIKRMQREEMERRQGKLLLS